jgi:hypothetical protein
MDEEHLLAQALPRTGGGRLIRGVRDPETDAVGPPSPIVPVNAIRAARRWLADSIVVGDWGDEKAAAELLGDLYARNGEPDRAANCYQWAAEIKKLTALAEAPVITCCREHLSDADHGRSKRRAWPLPPPSTT